jgi:uncharacterized protein DUF1876
MRTHTMERGLPEDHTVRIARQPAAEDGARRRPATPPDGELAIGPVWPGRGRAPFADPPVSLAQVGHVHGGRSVRIMSHWNIEVKVDDSTDETRAEIRLADEAGNSFIGIGLARGDLHGVSVPQITSELAVARALADVTEELLNAVAADIHSAVMPTILPN